MAEIKLNGLRTVRASSLLEVVVAMTVVVVVFGIALMIFTNITRASLSIKEIRARAILRAQLRRTEQSGLIADRSVDTADLRIEQEISPFRDDTSLSIVRLTAFDRNGGKIAELQKVIIK